MKNISESLPNIYNCQTGIWEINLAFWNQKLFVDLNSTICLWNWKTTRITLPLRVARQDLFKMCDSTTVDIDAQSVHTIQP